MSSGSSIYFDYPVRSSHGGSVEAFKFHPQFPLLAVSLTKESSVDEPKGIVSIYDQSVSLITR